MSEILTGRTGIADRYRRLRDILNRRQCFKLVCGAGNEDPEEVKKLCTVFTLAGATMLDVSANAEIVNAAQAGIEKAYALEKSINKKIRTRPYINVSIGLKGDPHVRKATIVADECKKCGRCIEACEQKAISKDFVIAAYRCIGCGRCETVCEYKAIKFAHKRADFAGILPECVKNGTEIMELHAACDDDEAVMRDWRLLNETIKGNYLSMCLDRSILSNKHLIERVRAAYMVAGERLIIQADGIPMSGEKDDYNNTLQAVACADIVQKSGLPVMILLSGGTNSKTGSLARQCGVSAHGVAIGSFARKIVKGVVLRKAVSIAEDLIRLNMEAIGGRSQNK